jgi:hypothetical protein
LVQFLIGFVQGGLCPTFAYSSLPYIWRSSYTYSGTCAIRHPTKNHGPKVFLLAKLKPEYSDIVYNPTHFTGPVVCQNRQVPLYLSWHGLVASLCRKKITRGGSHFPIKYSSAVGRSRLFHLPNWWLGGINSPLHYVKLVRCRC